MRNKATTWTGKRKYNEFCTHEWKRFKHVATLPVWLCLCVWLLASCVLLMIVVFNSEYKNSSFAAVFSTSKAFTAIPRRMIPFLHSACRIFSQCYPSCWATTLACAGVPSQKKRLKSESRELQQHLGWEYTEKDLANLNMKSQLQMPKCTKLILLRVIYRGKWNQNQRVQIEQEDW